MIKYDIGMGVLISLSERSEQHYEKETWIDIFIRVFFISLQHSEQ